MSNFAAEIEKALVVGEIPYTQRQIEDCGEYGRFLVEKNQVMNLTAITTPKDVAVKHFLDSLCLLKEVELPKHVSLIDIGTGPGFPGIPLKIFRPDIKITLLDSLEKRCKFLKEGISLLALEDISVICCRAEEGSREEDLRESFDFATARAVSSLPMLLEYAIPYLKVGGTFLPMKGKKEESSYENALTVLGVEEESLLSYFLPGTQEERCIYTFQKREMTDEKYPRLYAKMKKQPL